MVIERNLVQMVYAWTARSYDDKFINYPYWHHANHPLNNDHQNRMIKNRTIKTEYQYPIHLIIWKAKF